jgi:hypothetical protein
VTAAIALHGQIQPAHGADGVVLAHVIVLSHRIVLNLQAHPNRPDTVLARQDCAVGEGGGSPAGVWLASRRSQSACVRRFIMVLIIITTTTTIATIIISLVVVTQWLLARRIASAAGVVV